MVKLQRVLNAAARVLTGTIYKFDRGLSQILHDELHWLDVPDRVFKLAVTGICLLDTIAFMALEVVDDYCAV